MPSEARGGENDTTRVQNDAIVKRKGVFCRLDRKTKVMPELVTPELTLVRVADKEALDKYATARTAAGARVDYHLKGFVCVCLRPPRCVSTGPVPGGCACNTVAHGR